MATNYSGTKCPKCESTNFEYVEDKPTNALYIKHYLRCSKCKIFLANLPLIRDYADAINGIVASLKKIKTKLGI